MPNKKQTDNKNQPSLSDSLSKTQKRRKLRLEWGAILLVGIGLLILTLVQHKVLDLGPGLSKNQGVVTLVSINFSVLLSCLLIFLILRNLYRIFFEKQGYGTLQTKMVLAFICLSLVPTVLIFYYSYRLIIRGHDLWFSSQIEMALKNSLDLTESMLAFDSQVLSVYGLDILDDFNAEDLKAADDSQRLHGFLESSRRKFHLASVEIYGPEGRLKAVAAEKASPPPIYNDWFLKQLGTSSPWCHVSETSGGDLTRLVRPIEAPENAEESGPAGFLVIGRSNLAPIRSQMEDVRHALLGYQAALHVGQPFRVTQLVTLTGMTLLAVFLAIWIGSHLARSLTRPVMDLVDGTKKVAFGDLDFILTPQVRSGEFAELVASFNQMTSNLKNSYAELDSRRRFAETVLRNVSTGVVVMNQDGEVTEVNDAALKILSGGLDPPVPVSGFSLPEPLQNMVEEMLAALKPNLRAIERHISLKLGETILSLRITMAPLRNDDDDLGYILAFDDLSELERAQRLAAWQEVARRLAHEVKNPLTPIQLSTQRLRRRFGERLSKESDAAIFDECTEVIIRQVEEMKNLVDEFSRFARLPELKLKQGDFVEFLEDSLALFRQAHKNVEFVLHIQDRPLVMAFDQEQMRRVLTNLLDNAVAAMEEQGRVDVTLAAKGRSGLELAIADTGPGVSQEIMGEIFEPYVTAKAGGQGLGLPIVRTIINGHGGGIKVGNQPSGGAVFRVELPLNC